MSRKPSSSPEFGSPKSKVEGIDKTAQKAMHGDMQKGKGDKGNSKKLDSDGKVVDETGDEKVGLLCISELDLTSCVQSIAGNGSLGLTK